MARRTLQDWLRFWDVGPGRRALVVTAVLLAGALVTFTVAFKQFHGPRDETTLAQLAVARSLAEGRGFETRALHPQAAAWLASQGVERASGPVAPSSLPDVYQPPGYPLAASAALRLLPGEWRTALFGAALPPPQGYRADYYLLGWGIAGMLVVVAGVYWLGRRWFEARVGGWAAWAVLVCAPAWAGTLALTGLPLSMGLGLLLFAVTVRASSDLARPGLWACGAGLTAAALGLVDYPWLVAGPVVAVWLGFCGARGRSLRLACVVLGSWALLLAPWVVRNMSLTGQPLGLAGQDLFLRVGDSTAEPSAFRTLAEAAWPRVDWTKANHKLALHLEEVFTGGFWSVGGFLGAWFVVALAYRHQDPRARRGLGLVLLLLGFGLWAEGWLDAGEGQRSVLLALWPVLALYGARMLAIWAESRPSWRDRPAWVALGFALLQTLPLGHDLAEPAGIRFTYPPYYPALLQTLGAETERREGWIWMADVPAGAAWYSGAAVWAVPGKAEDFRKVAGQRPVLAVLLTPRTLDRPFFSELTRREEGEVASFWQWSDVYSGLASGRLPPGFPLQRVERYAPNLVVLIDGQVRRR